MLTLEQSNELRLEISQIKANFSNLLENKDSEIRALVSKLNESNRNVSEEAQNKNEKNKVKSNSGRTIKEYVENLKKIKNSKYNIFNDRDYLQIEEAINEGLNQVFLNNVYVSSSRKSDIDNLKNLALKYGFEIIYEWNSGAQQYEVESVKW